MVAAELSFALLLLARVPQYNAAMQAEKDVKKLLEHLLTLAKRIPAHWQIPDWHYEAAASRTQ